MKSIHKIFASLMVAGTLLGALGCKHHKDQGPDEMEVQLNKLNATWKMSSATKDNVLVDGYGGFTLNLSGSAGNTTYTYSTARRPLNSPWPSGGLWTFGTDVTTELIRDPAGADALPITYLVTDTSLELNFVFNGTGYPGGRVNSVSGNWKFKFTRQ